jgi:hypothetical protein
MSTEANGISIQNMCYQCQALDELCPDCQELKDSRDIYVAHQIVDEGNLQYQNIWSNGDPDVSGHDWVGTVVRLLDGKERNEFLEPVTNLVDRLPNDLETSMTVLDYEVLCLSCHLYHHESLSECPICY